MLAVKAHQYTADVLPLTTPHIYTVPHTMWAAVLKGLSSHLIKKNSAPCL